MTIGDTVVPHWYMYPPKCSYSDRASFRYEDLPSPIRESSIYIHIPFCNMKCSFCSLYTSAGYSDSAADRYVVQLRSEIADVIQHFAHVRSPNVYFGGGTPALLSSAQLNHIMSDLAPILADQRGSRSVEFSPDVVTDERTTAWIGEGFNRASLGIQSFDDERLLTMRRHHDGRLAAIAIHRLLKAGFDSVNVDLIFGGHGQTIEQWREDLNKVISSGADSCTFHPLALIPKTALERKMDSAKTATSNVDRLHYEAIRVFSDAGWQRTSAISFSRTGSPNPLEEAEALGIDTVGLGAGARSYIGNIHLSTLPSERRVSFGGILKAYLQAVERHEKPALSAVELDNGEIGRRRLILSLHHGAITPEILEEVGRVDGGAATERLRQEKLELVPSARAGERFHLPDSSVPRLAALGLEIASDAVRRDVARAARGAAE